MVRITLELLRRRAEHNDGALFTLEEVALHQQSIERLEMLQEACPKLKIVLLHDNLIPKIGASLWPSHVARSLTDAEAARARRKCAQTQGDGIFKFGDEQRDEYRKLRKM